jgi:hypothetical protein
MKLTINELKYIIETVKGEILTEGVSNRWIENMIFTKHPEIAKFAETPIGKLPYELQRYIDNNTILTKGDVPYKTYLRISLMTSFDINRGNGPKDYLKGITRIAVNELGFPFQETQRQMSRFKDIVLYIFNNEPNTMDADLNGATFNDLVSKYTPIMQQAQALNKEQLANSELGESDYTILPIRQQSQCREFAQYTNWCITTMPNQYNAYTKGGEKFYFCLKKGFEDVPREPGENCPLDEYGLSMISVLVNTSGEPCRITTRWNHSHNGENHPNLKTAAQLQAIVKLPFYDTFKPWTDEELKGMGFKSFDDVKIALENGGNPREVCDSVRRCSTNHNLIIGVNDRYNIFNTETKRVILPKWYEYIEFYEARHVPDKYMFRVEDTEGYNILTKDYKFASNEWFTYAGRLDSYGTWVEVHNQEHNVNYLNIDTKRLAGKEWFLNVYGGIQDGRFIETVIKNVQEYGTDDRIIWDLYKDKPVIDTPLTCISNKCLDFWVGETADYETILFSENGEIFDNTILSKKIESIANSGGYDALVNICDEINEIDSSLGSRTYLIHIANLLNIITISFNNERPSSKISATILSQDIWFSNIRTNLYRTMGLYKCYVSRNGESFYLMRKDGQKIGGRQFIYSMDGINSEWLLVSWGRDKVNYINAEGKYLLPKTVDGACPFEGEYGLIRSNGKYNMVNSNGKLVSKEWVDMIKDPQDDGSFIIKDDGSEYVINKDGEYISKERFQKVKPYYFGYSIVITLDGEENLLEYSTGQLVFSNSVEHILTNVSSNGNVLIIAQNNLYYVNLKDKDMEKIDVDSLVKSNKVRVSTSDITYNEFNMRVMRNSDMPMIKRIIKVW